VQKKSSEEKKGRNKKTMKTAEYTQKFKKIKVRRKYSLGENQVTAENPPTKEGGGQIQGGMRKNTGSSSTPCFHQRDQRRQKKFEKK